MPSLDDRPDAEIAGIYDAHHVGLEQHVDQILSIVTHLPNKFDALETLISSTLTAHYKEMQPILLSLEAKTHDRATNLGCEDKVGEHTTKSIVEERVAPGMDQPSSKRLTDDDAKTRNAECHVAKMNMQRSISSNNEGEELVVTGGKLLGSILGLSSGLSKFDTRFSRDSMLQKPLIAAIKQALGEEIPRTRRQMFAQSSAFQLLVALIVMAQSIIVGIETQDDMTHEMNVFYGKVSASTWNDGFWHVHLCFNLLFVLEMTFRISAYGWHFFNPGNSEQRLTNWFDLALAIEGCADIVISRFGADARKVIRSLRLLRLLKSFRLFCMAPQMRKMLWALADSINDLMMVSVMLWLMIFVFAMVFMKGTMDTLDNKSHLDRPEYNKQGTMNDEYRLMVYFGNIGHGMENLFASLTGGVRGWDELLNPLSRHAYVFHFFKIFFVVFFLLGVMNVVTAVFVENAMQMADHKRVLRMHKLRENQRREERELRALFIGADSDKDGRVSFGEWKAVLNEPWVDTWLSSLGLEMREYGCEIFQLMAGQERIDDEVSVDIDEFLSIISSIKGEARSCETVLMLHESRIAHGQLREMKAEVTGILRDIVQRIDRAQDAR